jgi:hypothetical protein
MDVEKCHQKELAGGFGKNSTIFLIPDYRREYRHSPDSGGETSLDNGLSLAAGKAPIA